VLGNKTYSEYSQLTQNQSVNTGWHVRMD
jgi:hypothetical protein